VKAVKTKLIAGLLLVAIMSLTLVAVVQCQPVENSKGGFNVEASEVRGKPSKPPGGGGKPSGGISTGTVADPASGARYAIVIGISDYETINDLQYCDDDANAFADALPESYQITLLIDGAATRAAILDAIATLEVGPNDEVVFFYSGHGSVSSSNPDGDAERKDECIIPYDAASLADFIWDGDLADAFSGFTCRIMFYFDSCYAGGMTDLAGPNRLICMACGEGQLSLESSLWSNGQFTQYFVEEGMVGGLADKNGDLKVTFEEAFDYAKANCQRQTPVASDGFTSDMLP
jgi:hypothetical protein